MIDDVDRFERHEAARGVLDRRLPLRQVRPPRTAAGGGDSAVLLRCSAGSAAPPGPTTAPSGRGRPPSTASTSSATWPLPALRSQRRAGPRARQHRGPRRAGRSARRATSWRSPKAAPSDPTLQLDTARGFLRLAHIQGVPGHPNFGEPELAKANLARAERLYAPLVQAEWARAHTGLALLEAYRTLLLAHGESKPAEAREALRRAEAQLARVPAASRGEDWMETRRNVRIAALEWGDLQLDVEFIAANVAKMEADIAQWPRSMRGGYAEGTDRARALYYRAIVQHNLATEESMPGRSTSICARTPSSPRSRRTIPTTR